MGLIDRKAAKIGLRTLHSDDIFVVSFPKSGNTWVRFLLANMIKGNGEVTFLTINDYVPGIYNFKGKINKKKSGRFIKTHDYFFDCYPKSIYIYRDYRDVVISYYHYLKGHNQFRGSLSEFIRSDQLKTDFGTWEEHVSAAINFRNEFPQRILFVGFDELKHAPEKTVKRMAEFCRLSLKQSPEEIVQQCTFENLKETEETHGRVFNNSNVNFFRSGQSEQWKTELNTDDLEVLMTDEVKTLLEELKKC